LALFALLGILGIVAVNAFASRLRFSAPLLLVTVGLLVSLQPLISIPAIEVEPEVILAGVLPLLLYAAAVSMPAANFRRDLRAISGLSVLLVVFSSLVLGALFSHMLPSLGWAGGVAVGAVLSPTDAVATNIVKKLGVAPRVVAMLDGESMLNDASALVLLRSAIAAMATTVTVGEVAWKFAVSIAIASAIGLVVGFGMLRVAKLVTQPTVSTLLSFTPPFVAYLPAEHLGASGLVAVVVAGLVAGHNGPRYLAPVLRRSQEINWRTVEMLLEGGLFLLLGLEIYPLIRDVRASDVPLTVAFTLAAAGLGVTLAVRALYAVPLLWGVHMRHHKYQAARGKLDKIHEKIAAEPSESKRTDANTRVRRVIADADYQATRPLGPREGVLLVWAGMRGAITLAAAQTLPHDFPYRSLVVLVAFLVAAASLLVQGTTLPWVIRHLKFPEPDGEIENRERQALAAEVEQAARRVLDDPTLRTTAGTPYDQVVLDRLRRRMSSAIREDEEAERFEGLGRLLDKIFEAQRAQVLAARADGIYSSEALEEALESVDSLQLGMQLASGRH